MRALRLIVLPLFALMLALQSCDFSPELHLKPKTQDVVVEIPFIITDLEAVWQIDSDWECSWIYGWDAYDTELWGKIEYPSPRYFQVRRYYYGYHPEASFLSYDSFEVDEPRFARRYEFGYYNLLLYSEVESADGTQVLIIDESDPSNIKATTSAARLRHGIGGRDGGVLNHPEIFYTIHKKGIRITDDPADYDYYDPENNQWVKKIDLQLTPLVYIYLVQVILHNNCDRVDGVGDLTALSGLADGVSLHTGHTSYNEANMAFPMRLKKGISTADGEVVDVLGGKLHTFGLCDMENWSRSRGSQYRGNRTDLDNILSINLHFINSTQKTIAVDVTDQMRRQARGGVITVHLDVNDIEIPPTPGASGSGFQPFIDDSSENVTVDIPI